MVSRPKPYHIGNIFLNQGYLKNIGYTSSIQTIDDLQQRITEGCQRIWNKPGASEREKQCLHRHHSYVKKQRRALYKFLYSKTFFFIPLLMFLHITVFVLLLFSINSE